MMNRLSIIGIFISEPDSVAAVNDLLHQYGQWVVGRMGIPHRDKGISVISLILDAPADKISSLAGNLGRIPGVNAKSMQAKM